MLNWLKSESKKPNTLGQRGEKFAQTEYTKKGFKIISANFFNKKGLRKGEVDFIAADKANIIFVEVKTRTSSVGRFGTGQEAVNHFKQLKLLKSVKLFLLQYPQYQKLRPQIDVCVVEHHELDKQPFSAIIIPNAVEDWN
jgi:putative endonuclease